MTFNKLENSLINIYNKILSFQEKMFKKKSQNQP